MSNVDETKSIYNLGLADCLKVKVGKQNAPLKVVLTNGRAEIRSLQMVINRVYIFPPNSYLSIFSYTGCCIKTVGKKEVARILTIINSMTIALNLQLEIRELRDSAKDSHKKGPISMLVAPVEVEKNTWLDLLLNYAASMKQYPKFVDLDMTNSYLSMPDTISILNIEKPGDIVKGFHSHDIQFYPFNFENSRCDLLRYCILIKKLGKIILSEWKAADKDVQSCGIIINVSSPTVTHQLDYYGIVVSARAFKVDTLYVFEDGDLYLKLKENLPQNVNVSFVPNLQGCDRSTAEMRAEARVERIREYFYGFEIPCTIKILFSQIELFKIKSKLTSVELTISKLNNARMNDIEFIQLPLGIYLVNHVLALSSASVVSEEMAVSRVIGFVAVTHVDTKHKTIEVLSPTGGPIPTKIFLFTSLKLPNIVEP